MTNRFERLLRLETDFQSLSKLRDQLIEKDDADVSGFQLANVLAEITKIEKEIKSVRRATALV